MDDVNDKNSYDNSNDFRQEIEGKRLDSNSSKLAFTANASNPDNDRRRNEGNNDEGKRIDEEFADNVIDGIERHSKQSRFLSRPIPDKNRKGDRDEYSPGFFSFSLWHSESFVVIQPVMTVTVVFLQRLSN